MQINQSSEGALFGLALRLKREQASTAELINWAIELLMQGQDTPALRRLAGCYTSEPLSESLPWFNQSLAELRIQLPADDQLISEYAAHLAREILQQSIPALQGLDQLASLNYQRQRWDPLLQPLCDLQAATELLADGLDSYAWIYEDFQADALEGLIQSECQFFLLLRQQPEAALILQSSYCLDCGQRALPLQAQMPERWLQKCWRLLTGRPAQSAARCAVCNSPNLLPLSRLAGRRRYLKESVAASEPEPEFEPGEPCSGR